jgi:hypothetical protein
MRTKWIFGFFLATVSVVAQSTNTAGMGNGRLWNSLTSGEKKAYLIGYWDDWALHSSTRTNPAPDGGIEEEYYPRSLGFEEVAKSLDAFYQVPENLNIQIRYALRILTLKVAGISDARVQSEVLFFRCITDHFIKDGHIKEVAVAESVVRNCKEATADPLPEKSPAGSAERRAQPDPR